MSCLSPSVITVSITFLGRKKDNGTFQGTTWQINFNLDSVNTNGSYTLRVALASVHSAELQV